MIKARFLTSDGVACGFNISGHAGYADKGHDIVCASVSSATQMAANTITEVIVVDATVSDVGGKVTLLLGQCADNEKISAAVAVIKGLRLHLSLLSKQYRGTISIEDSEV